MAYGTVGITCGTTKNCCVLGGGVFSFWGGFVSISTILLPNGRRDICATLNKWFPKGIPIIVIKKMTPSKTARIHKGIPLKIIQIKFKQ